ncbi:MAG: tetratricopeptide repeat protein [Nitrospirae bacterium]|nr:MAG: tetratricopeptide repeat protein [Nitrospirota bacterium]
MADDQPVHVVLWRRVRKAIEASGHDTSGNPNEVANRVRQSVDGDHLDRFLKLYYLERQYAGGTGSLSDQDAGRLVQEIEVRLEAAARTAAAPTRANDQVSATAVAREAGLAFSPLEEAEAYGEPEASPFSLGTSIRDLLREWRERRAAAAAKAEHARRRQVDEKHQRDLDQARLEEEARRRKLEAEEARALEAQRARDTMETAEAQRLTRDLDEAEKRRREMEERQTQDLAALRQNALEQSRRAAEAMKAGDHRGAVVLLEDVTTLTPEDAAGWFALAWSYGLDGNYRRSTQCYARGLALEPGNKVAWNNLGRDHRRRRRFKDSIKALEEALRLDPDYVTALANLGATKRHAGDFRGAAEAFSKVVARAQADPAAWFWLGVCHQSLREYDHAERAFRKALELDTSMAAGWFWLGECLKALKRKDEARTAFKNAGSYGPPHKPVGIDAVLAAAVALALSWAGALTASDSLATAAILACCVTLWRLRLSLPQLFIVLMPATIIFGLPFTEFFEAVPFAMAGLILFAAIIGRVWQRLA